MVNEDEIVGMNVVHAWCEIFGKPTDVGKTVHGVENGRASLFGSGRGELFPKSLVDWPGNIGISSAELGEAAEGHVALNADRKVIMLHRELDVA